MSAIEKVIDMGWDGKVPKGRELEDSEKELACLQAVDQAARAFEGDIDPEYWDDDETIEVSAGKLKALIAALKGQTK